MPEQKITLTVTDVLLKKIERAAEEKFQTVDQFILDCVTGRLSGKSSNTSNTDGILTFTEFSDWLANQRHHDLAWSLYEVVHQFVEFGGEEGMPVVAQTTKARGR